MTPPQFLSRIQAGKVPPVCLFLGMEAFERRRCRQALVEAHLRPEDRERGLAHYDAGETNLSAIVDDARAMSLFATERVILVTGAEAAVPRSGRASDDEEEDDSGSGAGSGDTLRAYAKDPTPGVLLLFEATRFDLEGEDKKKSDRVRKFYAAIPDVVEFKRFSPEDARIQLLAIARQQNLKIEARAAAMLVESLDADVARIASELEKLALYVTPARAITVDDVLNLIPDARTSTIFALVHALGRGERSRALSSLDALCRENEYLPLALAFLSTQFRQALAAQDAGLRSAQQIQSYLSKAGVNMWGSRAEQVAQTAQKFTKVKLEAALKMIFEADRDLRSARPDDRTVMENFVIRLTS